MKIKQAIWRLSLCLVTVGTVAFIVTGCSGGSLDVNKIPSKANSTVLTGDYQIPGETPIPGKTPVARPNTGTITVVVPRLDLQAGNGVSGTFVTSTLGTFDVTGNIDASGHIVSTGTNNGITGNFEGQLETLANGTQRITGRISFSNGQSASVTLTGGKATSPKSHANAETHSGANANATAYRNANSASDTNDSRFWTADRGALTFDGQVGELNIVVNPIAGTLNGIATVQAPSGANAANAVLVPGTYAIKGTVNVQTTQFSLNGSLKNIAGQSVPFAINGNANGHTLTLTVGSTTYPPQSF